MRQQLGRPNNLFIENDNSSKQYNNVLHINKKKHVNDVF